LLCNSAQPPAPYRSSEPRRRFPGAAQVTGNAHRDEKILALNAPAAAALPAKHDSALRDMTQLRAQFSWFQRQLFCKKSERRVVTNDAVQGTLRCVRQESKLYAWASVMLPKQMALPAWVGLLFTRDIA
jgi:hypothetical protein